MSELSNSAGGQIVISPTVCVVLHMHHSVYSVHMRADWHRACNASLHSPLIRPALLRAHAHSDLIHTTHTYMHPQGRKQEVAYMLGLLKSIFSFHLLLLPIIYLSCLSCHYDSLKIHSLIYSTLPEEQSICVCLCVHLKMRNGFLCACMREWIWERKKRNFCICKYTFVWHRHASAFVLVKTDYMSLFQSVCTFKDFGLKGEYHMQAGPLVTRCCHIIISGAVWQSGCSDEMNCGPFKGCIL